MHQIAERPGGDHPFRDSDLLAVDADRADAEGRPLMRQAGMRKKFERSGGAAPEQRRRARRTGRVEQLVGRGGGALDRCDRIAVRLIGVVKHESSWGMDAGTYTSICAR